jgi:hypothetical protein
VDTTPEVKQRRPWQPAPVLGFGNEEAKLRGFGLGLAPGVQSWDIRGTATGTRSTMAIVLPGGERSPLRTAIVCKAAP